MDLDSRHVNASAGHLNEVPRVRVIPEEQSAARLYVQRHAPAEDRDLVLEMLGLTAVTSEATLNGLPNDEPHSTEEG